MGCKHSYRCSLLSSTFSFPQTHTSIYCVSPLMLLNPNHILTMLPQLSAVLVPIIKKSNRSLIYSLNSISLYINFGCESLLVYPSWSLFDSPSALNMKTALIPEALPCIKSGLKYCKLSNLFVLILHQLGSADPCTDASRAILVQDVLNGE